MNILVPLLWLLSEMTHTSTCLTHVVLLLCSAHHIGLCYTPQMHMALSPPGVSAFALPFVWNISLISNPFHTVTWFFLWYFKSKLKCQLFREDFPEEPAKVELPLIPTTSHFLSHCTVISSSWHLTLSAVILGEGNGIPLQNSCLENPMDGGAWNTAVPGVAKSWTRLSDFTFIFHFHALEKEMATHSSVLA